MREVGQLRVAKSRLSAYEDRQLGMSLSCVILASPKHAFRISVLYIRHPSKFARKKLAPSAFANETSAPRRFARQKDVFTKRAPKRFAPSRLAPSRSIPLRSACAH